jgi:ribosome-binding protein aMBF1 (putative translation factor)
MKSMRWDDVKVERRRRHPVDEAAIERHEERMLAETRAFRLAEIREASGLKQEEVAERIGVSQSRISRMEHGDIDRAGLSTIRDYIEALGGEMEVLAKFGDERIVIA